MKKLEKLLCVNKRSRLNLVYNLLTIKELKIMNLPEKALNEMIKALMKGEDYSYSDDNTNIHVTPNGISIQYSSQKKEDNKEKEVNEFLQFVDQLDDDLFTEVCESFPPTELNRLQKELDTDNYRNTIKVFTDRTKEIAEKKLQEIIKAADAELKRQDEIISSAKAIIKDIHNELDTAILKYSL